MASAAAVRQSWDVTHQPDRHRLLCPTPDCPGNGVLGDIVVHSRHERRFKCRRCGHTFAASSGTPFYRLHHPPELMILVLALLAHGCPVQAIVFAYGLHEDTVRVWLERGGQQAQRVQEQLVQSGRVDEVHVQADELWVRLRRGRVWQALALAVSSRVWLAGQISVTRDQALIDRLVQQTRASLAHGRVLVCVDGLASYVSAFQQAFWERTQALGAGLWRLTLPRRFLLGQVIKQRRGRKLVSVTRRAVIGTIEQIEARLQATGTGAQIHTAYIERVNSTFRCSWAHLARRSRSLADQEATLVAGMYLVGTVYNLCREHASLRVEHPDDGRRWHQQTPAMAAGLTDHRWSVAELLWWRPPGPFTLPRQ
jgi:transposase-like protein